MFSLTIMQSISLYNFYFCSLTLSSLTAEARTQAYVFTLQYGFSSDFHTSIWFLIWCFLVVFSRTRLFICLPPRPLYKLRKLYSSLNISVSMYYFFVNISIDKAWKEHIQILHHTLWICYISYLQKVILNIARRSVSRLIRLIRDRIANSSSFTKLFAEAPVQVFIICLNNC